jgi:diadenosine tetraphosphate (Ap4A) HIT family hydrolase
VVSAKAPATSLSALGQSAAESLGPTLARLTSAIEAVTGAKTVYCARFGEEWPQVHFHLFPRTDDLANQYREAHAAGTRLLGPLVVVWACERFKTSTASAGELARLAEVANGIRKELQDA